MTTTRRAAAAFIGGWLATAVPAAGHGTAGPAPAQALRLHPDNPRYFLFRGRPTVVVTSGEHYGALLNADFDYRRYFDTLAADGLNGTRVFSGTYVETGGNFGIAANTLDPAPGRFLSPWARSTTGGYADGGARFDLTRFDQAYVARLRDLLAEAGKRGIIVELVLFCPLYEESMWAVSPMHPSNNVNAIPPLARGDVLTLDRSGPLLAIQEAVARHLVAAVAGFDNVYLEICNEPYATHVPEDWQRHMTTVVAEAVAGLPQPILLSQNVSNQGRRVVDPHPAISIFNFHYASPPDAVAWNAHHRKLIGDNETGFRGTADLPYRTEGWDFILAGGGLFNNLDYSFSVLAQGEDAFGVYLRRQRTASAFSARWSGRIVPPVNGTYRIHVTSNDGARVRIDDRVVYEDWTDHATRTDTVTVPLANRDGQPVRDGQPIAVEYFWNGGHGVMRLEWTRPDGVREPIPPAAFRTGLEGVQGLTAEYFHGVVLADPWFSRVEPAVDHDFATNGPRRDQPPAGASATLDMVLPAGMWAGSWIDPVTGQITETIFRRHGGGVASLAQPAWADDVAMELRRFVQP